MSLKVVFFVAVLGASAWGASLKTKKNSVQSALSGRLQYNESMTTMWMTDEVGQLVEVHLTKQSGDEALLSTSVASNVLYYLYTPEYNSAYQIYKDDSDTLESSKFDPSRPTKVLIHGFANTYQSDAEQLIKEAYLSVDNVNVIAVSWGALCKSPLYFSAVSHVKAVGQQVALLIDFLVNSGADVSSFHIIGHSLGAHVASFASNAVTTGNITRITGLDPALPLFASRAASQRLDPTDALTVDCVHSCGGYLGFWTAICTHDYYPNKGSPSQPGCSWDLTGSCSHGRSYRFFAAALLNADAFSAKSCASVAEVKSGSCSGTETAYMGPLGTSGEAGIYYLKTTSTSPYYSS